MRTGELDENALDGLDLLDLLRKNEDWGARLARSAIEEEEKSEELPLSLRGAQRRGNLIR